MNSDDKFIKKNLIKVLKYLKKSDEELIFINYLDDNKFTLGLNRNNVSKYNFLKEITKTQSLNYCFPYVYQRKFLLNNNIFFENFRYAEDFVFITKVFCFFKKFKTLDISLIKHRFSHDGLSSKKNIKYDSNYLAAIKILENFERKY